MNNERSSRRERKKSEVKDRIIKSALKVFMEKSFNETTIVDIMEEADLGTGTFYNYFQSKEDLVSYCIGEKVSEARLVIEQIKEKHMSPAEKISEIILAAGRVFAENRYLTGLFMQLKRTSQDAEKLPSHNNIFKDILSEVFREGQEKGEFKPDIPAGTVAEMIFGILQTSLMSRSETLTFNDNLRVKLNILFAGVLSQQTHNNKERNEANGHKNS